MDNFEALKAATLGAQQIQAPSSNPLGASMAPEISRLNQVNFQLPQSRQASRAMIDRNQVILTNQKQAAEQHLQDLKQQAQDIADQADPKSYSKVKKADGGFDFFDSKGNQIDIATLAQKTQTKPTDWIDDSENPIDIQYREQKKNLDKYIAAKIGGNKKVADAYETSDPALKQYQGVGGAHQLAMDFAKAFQRYYVPRTQDPQAWGANNGNNFFSGIPDNGTGATADELANGTQ